MVTINPEKQSAEEISAVLSQVPDAVISDGVEEPWDASCFVDALRDEKRGGPWGDYFVYTPNEWKRELEMTQEDDEG